jgi:hypothetical protein
MLLSRFWYVVLAAVAGISIAAMLIVRSTYERDRGRDSETLLRGDRRQIDEFMRTEARVRLDNLAPVASSPDLTRLMSQAGSRANDGPALRDLSLRISQQLRTLNNGMGGEASGHMLIAVDARGVVIGRVGINETAGIGDYLGGVPLVARALDGYVRDDTWELQGRVFRMAARPVIERGRYVGAVIHAREIDDAFVRRISEALGGASVAFFASGAIYASHPGEADHGRPAPSPNVLAEMIRTLPQDHQWSTRGYTDVLHVQNGQGAAVYGSLAGTVGINGGGFAIGRPRPVMPADYLLHAPSDEVRRVPWAKVVIPVMVLGSILGLLFVYLEHDRGATALRGMLNQLAERKIERLDPMLLRGNARKTALAINEAFERAMKEELARTGGKPRRSVEDLDALLGPAQPPADANPFGDIPLPGGLPAAPPRASSPNVLPPAPPPAPVARPAGGPPPPPPARPAAIGNAAVAMAPAPTASVVPAETLGVFANEAEEQVHWREIFEQFVSTKKQCNEPIDGLVFEKFSATLAKNKEQLVSKTGARAVRFSVYVKDGKATLKASPVK